MKFRNIGGELGNTCRIAVMAFGLAYVLALFVHMIGTHGWFGLAQDPLAGVFLALLGLPWNLVDRPDSWGSIFGVFAPLVNLCLIGLFGGMFRSRATP